MPDRLRQRFTVAWQYDVHFTDGMFDPDNPTLAEVLTRRPGRGGLDASIAREFRWTLDRLAA